jgi:hypothetical protein
MIDFVKKKSVLSEPRLLLVHEDDKIIALRGRLMFVYNFHAKTSFDYQFDAPPGEYEMLSSGKTGSVEGKTSENQVHFDVQSPAVWKNL